MRREISNEWHTRNSDWLPARQAAIVLGLFRITACSDGRGAIASLFHVTVPYAAPHAFQNSANTANRDAGKAFETLAHPANYARYMFTNRSHTLRGNMAG